MAETAKSSANAETKAVVNTRAEIDTTPPFESVKEAVNRFGGGGPCMPHHFLRLAAAGHHGMEVFDAKAMEEQAVELERDMILKEHKTLQVLKQLEEAKHLVEEIKVALIPESSSVMAGPEQIEGSNLCPFLSPGSMFMELNQAKLNLTKTSVDLELIQASVESLNKEMRRDKVSLDRSASMQQRPILSSDQNFAISKQMQSVESLNKEMTRDMVSLDKSASMQQRPILSSDQNLAISKQKVEMEVSGVNFEAEQFKKLTEASRYEVIKAMADIERIKNSIKMAEMRLNAAKRIEEAAKAIEAIALAERSHQNSLELLSPKPEGITLSFDEYQSLILKARQAEDLCKTKRVDTSAVQRTRRDRHQLDVPVLEKFEEVGRKTQSQKADLYSNKRSGPDQMAEHVPGQQSENNCAKFKFRNSVPGRLHCISGNKSNTMQEESGSGFWSITSIGDIMSKKLNLRDDVVLGYHPKMPQLPLSQMLREKKSRLNVLQLPKATADGKVEKQQRKKFGFIQLPLSNKQSKKKTRTR